MKGWFVKTATTKENKISFLLVSLSKSSQSESPTNTKKVLFCFGKCVFDLEIMFYDKELPIFVLCKQCLILTGQWYPSPEGIKALKWF